MNYDKELKSTHSKSKAQWWRMGLIMGFIVTLGIINFGCKKCEECEECDPDEYYIKYAVGLDTRYMGVGLDIVYTNEYNETTPFSTESSWNMTLGPVEKGFTASLSGATQTTPGNTILLVKIYVSKNDSPFALKASDESDDLTAPLQIDYTIDY